MKWTWARGGDTTARDFGDPVTTTSYAVCLYEADSSLFVGLRVPAGGTCGPGPCWKSRGTKRGFRYHDREGTPSGVEELQLKPSKPGRTRIDVDAAGPNMSLPALRGLQLPLRVQAQGNGLCWESTFSADSDPSLDRFRGRSE